jgi:hypothetical protein
LPPEHPQRRNEKLASELTSASLEYVRALRDAMSEAMFFQTYGNLFSVYLADRAGHQPAVPQEPRELAVVQQALAGIEQGGYAEAAARAAFLLARRGEPLPLSRLELKKDLLADYKDLLPRLSQDEARRVRGAQELIVRYAPEQAIATLPRLLPEASDRERFLSLLQRLMADERVQDMKPLPEQVAMLERIRSTVGSGSVTAPVRRITTRPARRAAQ